VKIVQWRNTDLDFSSVGALQAALAAAPTEDTLTRAPVAEDILVLDHAAREDEVKALTTTSADVERLWDVCQVPDYRKIAPATHAELVVALYGYLQRDGAIPTDWFAGQVAFADRTDGDIDTLSNRIAHIRTWTFAANRPDWLADPEHWQGVTRAVEDKLSDALHERLTERFIDRRTSVLMRRLRENAQLEPEMSKNGEVIVEGHAIGRLDGFVFLADASSSGSEAKALQNAAQKALAGEIAARATKLAEAPDAQFVLASDGTIRWTGAAVGKLVAGEEALRPRVRVIADEHLSGAPREAVETRLAARVKSHIEKLLGPLFELSAAGDVMGIARGVAFQLVEALGVLDRARVADEVKGLQQPERATLRKYGVRFGAYHIYVPSLLKPAPRALSAQLWALMHEGPPSKGVDDLLQLAGSGRTSIPVNQEIDAALYRVAGYRVCGERAVRVDILERLADLIRPALAWREGATGPKPAGALAGGGFTVVNSMTSLIGAAGEDFASVLRSLGYRMEKRPKPAEPEPAPAPPSVPTDAGSQSEPGAESAALVVPSGNLADPDPLAADAEREPVPETSVVPPDVSVSTPELAPAAPVIETPADAVADAPADAAAVAAPETQPVTQESAATPVGEPELIEVWRPGRTGRPDGKRRPRGRQRGAPPGRSGKPASDQTREAAAPSVAAEAPAVPAAAVADPPANDQPASADASTPQRPSRHRRRQGPDRRFDRPDRPRRERERPSGQAPWRERQERHEKTPDPNSPFAKLAALKAQLEADAKERQ
jgi:ATP-dependent RNA helicase SUPV3L1/SUV3